MNRPLCLLICEIILTEGEEEQKEEGGGKKKKEKEKKEKKRRKRKFRETIGCRVSSVFPSPFIRRYYE